MSKKIPLTHGQYATVDDEDFDEIMKHNWRADYSGNYSGKLYRAVRSDYSSGKHKNILMHRQIMGNPIGKIIDHINHDPSDNRKSNLRIATRSQNQSNLSKKNFSNYHGVFPHGNKWKVNIWENGKTKYIGLFEDLEYAARVRDEYMIKIHGRENIDLNFNDS